VARRKGAAAVTYDANGGQTRNAIADRDASSSLEHPHSQYAVTDGRPAIGTVEIVDGHFIALDVDGNIVGKFGTLMLAVRVLPGRAA
jgi:hypothetical protein